MAHPHTYIMRGDSGAQKLEAPSDEAAVQAARAILSEDGRDDRSATAWTTASLCRRASDAEDEEELVEAIEIELPAEVPDCAGGSSDQHVWRKSRRPSARSARRWPADRAHS